MEAYKRVKYIKNKISKDLKHSEWKIRLGDMRK